MISAFIVGCDPIKLSPVVIVGEFKDAVLAENADEQKVKDEIRSLKEGGMSTAPSPSFWRPRCFYPYWKGLDAQSAHPFACCAKAETEILRLVLIVDRGGRNVNQILDCVFYQAPSIIFLSKIFYQAYFLL
jgi:hypothetical protein